VTLCGNPVAMEAGEERRLQIRNVALAVANLACRGAAVDRPIFNRSRDQGQGTDRAVIANVGSGQDHRSGTDDRMPAEADGRYSATCELTGDHRVRHVPTGVIIARGVDAHPLGKAGEVVEGKPATRHQMTECADMDVTAKAHRPCRDDRARYVDPHVVADLNLVEANNGAVLRNADVLADARFCMWR
jgi:hypothetical protein